MWRRSTRTIAQPGSGPGIPGSRPGEGGAVGDIAQRRSRLQPPLTTPEGGRVPGPSHRRVAPRPKPAAASERRRGRADAGVHRGRSPRHAQRAPRRPPYLVPVIAKRGKSRCSPSPRRAQPSKRSAVSRWDGVTNSRRGSSALPRYRKGTAERTHHARAHVPGRP